MVELITKQSALDAIDKESEFIEREINNATKHPDEYTDNFISFSRERQCGLSDAYIAVDELSPVETITDDDLISRQAVRNVILENYRRLGLTDSAMTELSDKVKSLPSAEPKGTWKRKGAYGESDMRDAYVMGLRDAKTETTPSAEPVHGEWILADEQRKEDTDNDNYRYICSECGHSDLHSKSQEVPYCWWCGAKMLTKESLINFSLKADGEVVSKGGE